jgi:uncharacterized damage-inducible protein DinB
MKKMSPPTFEELNDYYKSYWNLLKDDDLLSALTEQGVNTMANLSSLPGEAENFAYADGKWMLKEVIGHLCDTERILSYRALRFARNDKTSLPGFDDNNFTRESNYRDRTLKDIREEWKTVRAATISLFSSMTDEIADRKGDANGVRVSPRVILYFILVHERHHLQVIKERYLSTAFSV